jgi:hypothetical protein
MRYGPATNGAVSKSVGRSGVHRHGAKAPFPEPRPGVRRRAQRLPGAAKRSAACRRSGRRELAVVPDLPRQARFERRQDGRWASRRGSPSPRSGAHRALQRLRHLRLSVSRHVFHSSLTRWTRAAASEMRPRTHLQCRRTACRPRMGGCPPRNEVRSVWRRRGF